MYRIAAEIVLVVHAGFVLFVVLGQLSVLLGWQRNWNWVRNRVFRWLHLLAISVVVIQAWLGIICPLTHLENYFREKAGIANYQGSFIGHWVDRLLYYHAPAWVFVLVYSVFAALVFLTWIYVPPGPQRNRKAGSNSNAEEDDA